MTELMSYVSSVAKNLQIQIFDCIYLAPFSGLCNSYVNNIIITLTVMIFQLSNKVYQSILEQWVLYELTTFTCDVLQLHFILERN